MKTQQIAVLAVWSVQVLLAGCQSQAGTGPAPSAAPVEVGRTADPTATARATEVTALPQSTAIPTLTATPPPTATAIPTATPQPTPSALGAAERPVLLLFPPVANSVVIAQRSAPLIERLETATGAQFTVGIADNEAAVVHLLCAAPADTIGFLSAAAYTIANEECNARPALVARQTDGLTWQAGMLVTRPGAAAALSDLDGKRWAVADTHSLPNYLSFRAQMAGAGIEPSEVVVAPEETSALLALFNDEVDFTTASFTPPIMPRDQVWQYGENEPEEWRLLGIPPSRSPIGYVIVAAEPEFGGYRLRDARARLFDTTPDIFNNTRIMMISEPFPNETVVLGAELPPEVVEPVLAALIEFAASDACEVSLCSADFYGWTGLEPVNDAAYDPIRTVKNTLELDAADLWAELD